MTTVTKPEAIRELGRVDVAPLQRLVERLSERFWAVEDDRKENKFAVLNETQHVIFRFIPGNSDHRTYYSTPIWTIWQPTLLPLMEAAAAPYGFARPAYPKAMLARLKAGHEIDRHVDGAGSNLHTHKIHVPLQTNPAAEFFVNDAGFHLAEGVAYEVNNVVAHGARNGGATDRIHFIFEVYDEVDP